LKQYLLEQNEIENQKRLNKQISPLISLSTWEERSLDFKKLINFNQITDNKTVHINDEIFQFMHLLMDECTHMVNYDTPFDTSLIKVIAAKDDAYILRDGVDDFKSIWPGKKN
jgi:hypothetical protein